MINNLCTEASWMNGSSGQPRRAGVRLDVKVARDCRGEDAFRGRAGGTCHATEAVVLADQPAAAPVHASRGWRRRPCWS